MKDEGIVSHIGAYFHALPKDILKILKHDVFESITVPFSVANLAGMLPVLDEALARNISVIAMNPLGDGIITRDAKRFSFLSSSGSEEDVAREALRFAAAHPAVDMVLVDVHNIQELNDAVCCLAVTESEAWEDRLGRVAAGMGKIRDFCLDRSPKSKPSLNSCLV